MDDTSRKIVDAAMSLVRDKGSVAIMTKDIAKLAGVNECTLFRKFKSKIESIIEPEENVLPIVPPGNPLSDMIMRGSDHDEKEMDSFIC